MDENSSNSDEKKQQLEALFSNREASYKQVSEQIVDLLKPSLLEGIRQFVKIDESCISIMDVELDADVIVALFSIETVGDKTSDVLEVLSPTPEGTATQQRLLRIQTPITIAISSSADVLSFLTSQFERILAAKQTTKKQPQEFNTEQLTREQKDQLLWFQHASKTAKH